MNNLLFTVSQLLEANPEAMLTGSLMLNLRGIDLGRNPSDIDLVMPPFSEVKIPENMTGIKYVINSSSPTGEKFTLEHLGVKVTVDVLWSEDDSPEIIEGLRCARLDGLIQAKLKYYHQGNAGYSKHMGDLHRIGEKYPKLLYLEIAKYEKPITRLKSTLVGRL